MGPKITYSPEQDIADLNGKVFFITGGTAGIGRLTILELAKHNASHIHFTGRNKKSADSLIAEVGQIAPNVGITFYECDQTSFLSIENVAKSFLSSNPTRLDVLICNAGIMGGAPGLSKDGYEIQFGINFLSHALLTKRFIPLLERTASEQGEARIINVSSSAYEMQKGGLPFEDLKTTQGDLGMFGQWARYGQSKFAQILYTAELAKRHPTITSIAIHPSVVWTGIIEELPFLDRLFIKAATWGQKMPLHQGAYNECWAATTPRKESIQSGSLYYPVGVKTELTKPAADEKLWAELWDWTEKQLEGSHA
ncbi:dehydrogenase with different specificitie [Lophiotrema nucula]|uniref:Dehydrogenase with different specificitie n=1 Tax=Lophiotrema nucula TaxID=690887 RepID=A0A6A5YNJ2_9PLEO|nr:dehydrogenase with different specificitie [Lophiotrema nucula]